MSLAAAGEAYRYFLEAAALADDPHERADLLERAGQSAAQDERAEQAHGPFGEAIELLDGIGERRRAARVEARLAGVLRFEGQGDEGPGVMPSALQGPSGAAAGP